MEARDLSLPQIPSVVVITALAVTLSLLFVGSAIPNLRSLKLYATWQSLLDIYLLFSTSFCGPFENVSSEPSVLDDSRLRALISAERCHLKGLEGLKKLVARILQLRLWLERLAPSAGTTPCDKTVPQRQWRLLPVCLLLLTASLLASSERRTASGLD